MQLASKLSLDNGSFVDTKFYAFSRRNTIGMVYAPRAIYANSWILRAKSPQYFESLLFAGYDANCTVGRFDDDLSEDRRCLDEADSLGYDSDSDIEDDDDDYTPAATTKLKNSPRSSAESSAAKSADLTLPAVSEARDDSSSENNIEAEVPGQQGRIVVLRSFAYPTWKAFIYYLYTGKVVFAPLRSRKSAVRPPTKAIQMSASAPACSPKSMYKLADELGISELRDLALKDIQSQLSSDNILAELFSTFTSRYDAIRDMEIVFACDKAKATLMTGASSWMNAIPAEILKRNVAVIGLLVEKLAGAHVPTTPAIQKPISCPSCRAGNNGYQFYLRCSHCNYNMQNAF
ncbi:hypothetical protein PsYK624_027310 [Phanerochaete sordida]|uniref:BTB domain-containing protein n=1 Tax=Phanerochaete sordida TaxID=48140 RepID=A0A9P3L909_9APHY|nr:hypothetical protein PsYK624_027310 [Phanerochaete sordida]